MTKEALMERLRESRNHCDFYIHLKSYMLFRLKLPIDVHEDRIERLVIFSVKMQAPDADPVFVEEKLAGVDCHQTSYIVSKKVLLMMEVERLLDIYPNADEMDGVETVSDYAKRLWNQWKEKSKYD